MSILTTLAIIHKIVFVRTIPFVFTGGRNLHSLYARPTFFLLFLSAVSPSNGSPDKRKILSWYDRTVDLGFLFGARRKNLIGASVHFAKHTLPVAMRPARILWHQMIGFLFILLAMGPANFAYKAIQGFKGDGESWTRVILSGVFIAVMLGYGISSFLRARKLSKL